jgi:hypothetical protein
MASWFKQVRVVVATAAITCGTIVVGAWPSSTHADDPASEVEGQQDIGTDTTVIGTLRATSRLVADAKAKGKWWLEVSVENTGTEGVETAELEEQLQKATYNQSMGRGGPIPTVAWKVKDTVSVGAKQTVVRRHAVPGWLAWQITNSVKPQRLDRNGNPMGMISTTFSTVVAKA